LSERISFQKLLGNVDRRNRPVRTFIRREKDCKLEGGKLKASGKRDPGGKPGFRD